MDDLLGEDWQAPSKAKGMPSLQPTPPTSNFSSFRASPQPPSTGTSSPLTLSRPTSTVNSQKSSTADQFGNLLSTKATKPASSGSLLERQKQLIEERRRQQELSAQQWDNLASGRGTPEFRAAPVVSQDDEDDILAAFNQAAPVNKASHFPPPQSQPSSGRSTAAPAQLSNHTPSTTNTFEDDDDDLFGLTSLPSKDKGNSVAGSAAAKAEDDDILGDLGKPFIERKPSPPPVQHRAQEGAAMSPSEEHPQDRAIAELVDMGFPPENARTALNETGGDVQNAVSWLLRQAHEESKRKIREEARGRESPASHAVESGGESRSGSKPRRYENRSPANGEKDAATVAQDLGSKLFKSANSLWKASQKQMTKTIAEFQQERDSSQPRWMSEGTDSSRSSSQRREAAQRMPDVTDEAAMLDAPRDPRLTKPSRQAPAAAEQPSSRTHEEPLPHRPSHSRPVQQPFVDRNPVTKLSRKAVEEQSAQAYVSPSRRKKATPQAPPAAMPEVDLFSPAPVAPAQDALGSVVSKERLAPRAVPPIRRPAAPPRNIPAISPASLSASSQYRKKGGEAFKRGDYVAAHEAYTAALSPIPANHPSRVVVLSNRSLTALKTGDPKLAISDADEAIGIIGASQGVGESIELGGGEGSKDMREFYGKAVMRKAEALENMEKWNDAASAWRLAIEAGAGGAIALRGRDRCEKAAAPKPAAVPKSAPKPAARTAKAAPVRPRAALANATSADAVKKLRDANAAAEKADDEKFALTDQVDAKLTAWKGSKADNLRALLQSLDGVLWAEAGWKKVGMSDLVMPNKVKIIYMKAIAKVHPDKIPQNATTEQRMISGAVFATLNEAWDKFKRDNNL